MKYEFQIGDFVSIITESIKLKGGGRAIRVVEGEITDISFNCPGCIGVNYQVNGEYYPSYRLRMEQPAIQPVPFTVDNPEPTGIAEAFLNEN